MWICAQRVEKLCESRPTRLNECGEATAQRTKSCTRRHGIKAAQKTSDTEAAAARTARRTASQRIHAADPRWIGEPLKVVSALDLNLATTLRSSRDWGCGGEGVCNARSEARIAARHDQWHASICKECDVCGERSTDHAITHQITQ
jgi:hypothetical protein